mmetsp:Transcript_25394/g.55253  ORF Transcript_25394/g.55253 Transcript_25394/m.55253 type:complete len:202 (-) Transcript_25394:113-718(-)
MAKPSDFGCNRVSRSLALFGLCSARPTADLSSELDSSSLTLDIDGSSTTVDSNSASSDDQDLGGPSVVSRPCANGRSRPRVQAMVPLEQASLRSSASAPLVWPDELQGHHKRRRRARAFRSAVPGVADAAPLQWPSQVSRHSSLIAEPGLIAWPSSYGTPAVAARANLRLSSDPSRQDGRSGSRQDRDTRRCGDRRNIISL